MSTDTPTNPPLEVHMFPCLEDNYGFLVHDPAAQFTACVDTPEVEPIMQALDHTGWKLTHIFNTHHHFDHAGGNLELKEKTDAVIVGPRKEYTKIPGMDIQLGHGDIYHFGNHDMMILETPGHTLGHIVFHFADSELAFVGDTLFALGCGRLFEGTAEQMWTSLQLLLELPDSTTVYCAHEYTQANARFALSVDPDNEALQARAAEIGALRAQGKASVPTTIGVERQTNPFLRPDDPAIRRTLGLVEASDTEVFAEIRSRKDRF